jgi:hypothetical protein
MGRVYVRKDITKNKIDKMEPKDYEDMYGILSKRINGGAKYDSLLDRLKREFMDYKILTIENIESIAGTNVHYKGDEWKIKTVERTSTTYNFLLSREWFIGTPTEMKMVLNRVQEGRVYTLHNDTNGAYQRVGKELLKDKNEFLKVLVGLTDELPF